jgi:hypothetical protein
MTFEQIERLRLFVSGHRHKSVIAASNARLNGYKQVALEHENEAALAAVILLDLSSEHGVTTNAHKKAYDQSR